MGNMRERTTDDGSTEFLFDEEAYRGLVFEEGESPAVQKKPAAKAKTPPKKQQQTEEFSLPTTFSAPESAQTPSSIEEPLRTYHAYVPVFTEASENYRMTGRTTRPTEEPTPTQTPPARRESMKAPVVEVVASVGREAYEPIHDEATAELPEEETVHEAEQTVVVRVEPPRTAEPSFERMFVSEPIRERTLDEEKEEIHRLLYGEELSDDAPSPSAEDVRAEDTVQPCAPAEAEEPKPQADGGHIDGRVSVPDPECEDSEPVRPMMNEERTTVRETPAAPKRKRRREKEYQMYSDSTKIKNHFLDNLVSFRVRMSVAACLSVLLLVLALLPSFDVDVRALLSLHEFKALPALIDLQLCLCVLAITLPEIIKICEVLFAKQLLLSLLPLSSTLVFLAYDVYMCFADITTYPLYGSLYAIGLLTMIVAAYLMQDAMFSAFKLISVKGAKRAIERVKTRELETENMALDGAIDEYSSYTARMFKTSFISGFFHRHRPAVRRAAPMLLTLGLLGGCSLVVGTVVFFLRDGWFDALSSLAMTFLAAVPLAWVLCRPLSYSRAERCCFLEDSAVIGEQTLFDYADVDVVTYTDTEVFGQGDVALKRVLIYGDKSRLPGALRQMASLFLAVGGPLNTLFANTLDRRPLPAVRIRMMTDGVSGETEGCAVHAGTADYMLRHGFSIPTDSQRQEVAGTTRVLYLAEGGVVYAKFIFRYAFSEEFSQLIPIFKEKGIVPLIYTRDPNVTRELLLALTTGEDLIRELHVTTPEVEDEAVPTATAGMVTLGNKNNAIQLILLAKDYVRYHKRMDRLFLAQTLCGLALGAVFSFVRTPLLPVPCLLVWQLLWCALTVGFSTHAFSLRKKRRELIENEKELTHE